MDLSQFKRQFSFSEKNAGLVGVERESFVTDRAGRIVPSASKLVQLLQRQVRMTDYKVRHVSRPGWNAMVEIQAVPDYIHARGRYDTEFSASVLEDRIGPCRYQDVAEQLAENDREIQSAARDLDLAVSRITVGPPTMPTDTTPDERYNAFGRLIGGERSLAACRVVKTDIHIGMPDHDTALEMYNRAVGFLDRLLKDADPERLRLYRIVTPDCLPRSYKSWEEYHQVAQARGFEKCPRSCFDLIRLSKYGTIEFRLFDATGDNARVTGWAARCYRICGGGRL